MNDEAKAKKIGEILDTLYPEPPIPLDHTDAFTLTIAVLLSAQCTDKRVNMVTPGLFALADNPYDMAKLSVEEILEQIKTCGLAPTKAKRIKAAAELLVEKWGGEVPDTLSGLMTLPGVGRKTALVVMSQIYGVPSFPVDTHIQRLATRWGLASSTNVNQTEKELCAVFPRDTWNRRHLQIIYFGREYCPARGHDPETCPICKWAAPAAD